MTTIAVNCTEDIKARLEQTEEFGNKIFSVFSEEDMLDKASKLRLPAVGVLYEGIFPEGGQDRSRQGLMGTLRVAVVLIVSGKATSMDRKDAAAELLDATRTCLLGTASPTGHKWQYAGEFPAGDASGVMVYLQRWQTAAPLTK